MSAQHHNLSSYAKLWRLNRQIKKKGLRRLEKCVPQNPPLVFKNFSEWCLDHETFVYK